MMMKVVKTTFYDVFLSVQVIMKLFSFYLLYNIELPWDEPREKCKEFSDWLNCRLINSPWNKIEPLSLGEYEFVYSSKLEPPIPSVFT